MEAEPHPVGAKTGGTWTPPQHKTGRTRRARRTSPVRRLPPRSGLVLDAFQIGALLALATALVVAFRGYEFGDSNHAVQVPLQRAAADPSIYARDLLVRSASGYATYFFSALSAVERLTGHMEALYFALYVLGHFLALSALAALARLCFRGNAPAAVACLLYLARPLALGGESSWFSLLTHAHMATGPLLWAFWLHLRGRSRAALALTGVLVNVHALYAVHVAALLGFDLLLRWREIGLRRVAQCGALCALLAAPTLAWLSGAGGAGLTPERLGEWLAIMRERSPQHAFPLDSRPSLYGAYGLLLGLAATAGTLPARAVQRRVLVHVFLGVLLLALGSVVFSAFLPEPALIRAQLMRATKWLTLLLLPLLGRGLAAAWRWGGASRAAACVAALGLLLSQYGLVALALLLLLLDAVRRRLGLTRVLLGGAALVIAAASAVASELPRQLGVGEAAEIARHVLLDPLLTSVVVLSIAARAALWLTSPRWRRALPALAAAAALALLPLVERRGRAEREARPWYQVQVWARAHTPREALFLTPPYEQGFRVFSERAVVGEWKDGTQQFFSAPFAFEWRARMRQLAAPGRGYDGLRTARLAALGRQYGADFVVARVERPLELPRVYANAEWAVYSLAAAP